MRELQVITDENGNKVVVLPDVIFNNKQHINWNEVEDYLKRYIGKTVDILKTKDKIRIGNKFPDEYAGSKYTRALKGVRAKAKANAVQGIVKMVQIADNRCFSENKKQKHQRNAGRGWYYYITRFALPVYDNQRKLEGYRVFSARIVVNRATNGNMYLYDLIDIKKEAGNPLKTKD